MMTRLKEQKLFLFYLPSNAQCSNYKIIIAILDLSSLKLDNTIRYDRRV